MPSRVRTALPSSLKIPNKRLGRHGQAFRVGLGKEPEDWPRDRQCSRVVVGERKIKSGIEREGGARTLSDARFFLWGGRGVAVYPGR